MPEANEVDVGGFPTGVSKGPKCIRPYSPSPRLTGRGL